MIMQLRSTGAKGNQSIRIPNQFAFPDEVEEVRTIQSGPDLIISPVRRLKSWKEFFERGPWVPEDFMSERVDLPPQERDFPD